MRGRTIDQARGAWSVFAAAGIAACLCSCSCRTCNELAVVSQMSQLTAELRQVAQHRCPWRA
ncbi:MAG: hypothetical protein JWN34_4472 [Bryobacterales bacterium]|nr:hypothetical protein [Bryobacterales bacterium]